MSAIILHRRTCSLESPGSRVADRLNFEVFHCYCSLLLRRRGVDLARIHYASLCIACHRTGTAQHSSGTPARYRQDLLANNGSLSPLFTWQREKPFWPAPSSPTPGICLSTIGPSHSHYSPTFPAEASSQPSQVCEPKLQCDHENVGAYFRKDATMTRSELASNDEGLDCGRIFKPWTICPRRFEWMDLDESRNIRK